MRSARLAAALPGAALVTSLTVLPSLTVLTATPLAAQGEAAGAPVRGRVVAADGRPLADAIVVVPGAASARTDSAGAFAVRTAESGALVVRVTAVGYAAQVRTLLPGAQRTDLTFRLAPAAAQQLAPIAVRGDRETANSPVAGYLARRSTTGLRIDVPVHDIPVSVQVVPRDVITDRAALSTDEAVENISGVRLLESFPFANGYQVRGFYESANGMRDGYREQTGATDISNVERVEFIKGPASAVYGGGQLNIGGVINTITKRPQADARRTLEVIGGGQNTVRGTLDATGPVDSARRLLYRVVASAEHRASYVDFQTTDNQTIAPSLTWRPTDRDELRVAAEADHYRFPWANGFPLDSVFLHVPASRNLADPGLTRTTLDQQRATGEFAHAFSPALTLRGGGTVGRYQIDVGEDRVYNTTLEADGRTIDRTVSRGPQYVPSANGQIELLGQVATGPAAHALAVGVEQYWINYHYRNETADLGPLDVFAPRYGATPGPFALLYEGNFGDRGRGVYAQDFVTIGPYVKVLAGVRRDGITTFTDYTDPMTPNTHDQQQDRKWSPRGGVTVTPTTTTALYVNGSTAFVPNFGFTRTGTRLDPSRARQVEVGVKQDAFDGRLAGSLALYQIRKSNVPTVDPTNNNYSITVGGQRSRGVEADVSGALTPAWRAIASYAYTDVVVTADNAIPVGSRIPNVPRNAGSLWTTYDLLGGAARGVQLGAGVYAASRVTQGLPALFTTPRYARVDAEAAYRVARYRVALNVKNLNDARYYTGDGLYTFRPASPRQLLASLRADF